MRKHEEAFSTILGHPTVIPPPPPPPTDNDPLEAEPFEPGGPAPVLPPDREGPLTVADALLEHVREPSGVYFVPTYVPDLLVRNLSLAEQAVFHQLLRLAAGFRRPSPRVRPTEIGEACALRPPLVRAALESLVQKRLVRIVRRNPFTGAAVFQLMLPPVVKQHLKICAVCHEAIDEASEEWLPVPVSIRVDGTYQNLFSHAECLDGATL